MSLFCTYLKPFWLAWLQVKINEKKMDPSEVLFFFSWKKKHADISGFRRRKLFWKTQPICICSSFVFRKVHLNQIELNSISAWNKIDLPYTYTLNNAFVFMQLHIEKNSYFSLFWFYLKYKKDSLTANIDIFLQNSSRFQIALLVKYVVTLK